MAVVAGGVAGGAHAGDLLALVDVLANGHQQAGVVAVVGHIAVAVVDLHQVAIAAHPAGVGNGAAVGRVDRRALGRGDVDALVVGGADAAGRGPAAEVGGDAAGGGPAEGAGGQPGGPLLGTLQPLLGHRLLEGHGGEHRALGLLAVDIGDVCHHVGGAVLALGRDLVVTLIQIGGVGVLNVVHDIFHIPLLPHHGHGQVGNGGG